MTRKLFILALALMPLSVQAATHPVTYTAPTGGTYYDFPSGQSLADWTTYRIQLTEDSAPNTGRYSGTLDDAQGTIWYRFSGATQPGGWDEAIGVTTLEIKSDVTKVSGDSTSADNLESYTDGTTPQPVNATLIDGNAPPNNLELLAISAAGSVDSLVQGFIDTVITETTPGRIANNLKTFFANADAATTAVVDDVEDAASVTSQPRINRKPDPAFTVKVSRRADGTHKATSPIRITPGDIDQVFVFIDMSPLFGQENYVNTVGTPTVEAGGSITASAEGPRDTYAVVELDGTATASEERTITVPVTMDSGTTVNVAFDVSVFAE